MGKKKFEMKAEHWLAVAAAAIFQDEIITFLKKLFKK